LEGTLKFTIDGGFTTKLSNFNDEEYGTLETNFKNEYESKVGPDLAMVAFFQTETSSNIVGRRTRRTHDVLVVISLNSATGNTLLDAQRKLSNAVANNDFSFRYTVGGNIFSVTSSDMSNIVYDSTVPELCGEFCNAHAHFAKHGKIKKDKGKKDSKMKRNMKKGKKTKKVKVVKVKKTGTSVVATASVADHTACIQFCPNGNAPTPKKAKKKKNKGKFLTAQQHGVQRVGPAVYALIFTCGSALIVLGTFGVLRVRNSQKKSATDDYSLLPGTVSSNEPKEAHTPIHPGAITDVMEYTTHQ
jgi:hypothetical protein